MHMKKTQQYLHQFRKYILYVALTRAQEKLICTGMIRAGGDKNVEAVIADYRYR